MNNRLRNRQKCPVHNSYWCCGREPRQTLRKEGFVNGARRIEDPYHARGYREICTAQELRRRKNLKIAEQKRICPLCKKPFDDYRNIELDHIEPKGMGGARRDDHIDNLQATHRGCNFEKGSKRL